MPISPKGVAAGVAAATLLVLGIDATTTAATPTKAAGSPAATQQFERRAASLAPTSKHAISYRAGWPGQTMSPGGLWSMPVDPGLYEVSFTAMLWDRSAQGPANYICGVIDLETYGTEGQVIYVAASAPYLGASPAALSGTATVRVREGSSPGAVCFPDTGTFTFYKPLTVTYTRIDSRERRVAETVPITGQARANPFD